MVPQTHDHDRKSRILWRWWSASSVSSLEGLFRVNPDGKTPAARKIRVHLRSIGEGEATVTCCRFVGGLEFHIDDGVCFKQLLGRSNNPPSVAAPPRRNVDRRPYVIGKGGKEAPFIDLHEQKIKPSHI